jgi:glutaredoxin-like YruB-family protein
MLDWIKDRKHLQAVRHKHRDYFVLAFWGKFSDAAQRALGELEQFAREHKDVPVFVVDVQKLKGVHKQFDVARVPTVLAIEKGKVSKSVEGVQSARFYSLYFAGAATHRSVGAGAPRVQRVVVYSGPGCPACGQLKNYLRRHGVSYREVDVSRDPRAAERIARRSGMMAVPQTDVNGRLVVGFDQAKLSRLLGIQPEGRGEQ